MTEYKVTGTDVAVIGAGHAGIEAALACARLGIKTVMFTLTMDLLGNMPCNPSIGGTGKGHLVFELNSLGGEMGKAADYAMLQSRMLNESKGPAVHSLRMQQDRRKYHDYMKRAVENTENLTVVQAEVTEVRVDEGGNVVGVLTRFGAFYEVKAAIICTGTSLAGRIIVGEAAYDAGPDNTLAATELTKSLLALGIKIVRFKTGTPARIHADSIDYSKLEVQYGDEIPVSFTNEYELENKSVCYVGYTNAETHKVIRENLHRSPLYSGMIKGTGPRYCPSIEDKIVRFADKERHQLFLEPMGENTKEIYVQGMSSSLPEDVQKAFIHTIKGLENAVFMRPAYAIEYDCIDPTQLYHTLEFKDIHGLYGAGQFNGSSGYEEAAVQGLIAGINAALKLKGEGEFTLLRSEAYIGALIDDLVVKGTNEPYRIMTSRSEYRLLLRQDNSDSRLMKKGYDIGLISEERYGEFLEREKRTEDEIYRLQKTTIPYSEKLSDLLVSKGYEPLTGGIRAADLLRRPHVTYAEIEEFDVTRTETDRRIIERAQIEIKYEGYIKRQIAEVEKFKKLEEKQLPGDIDYSKIRGIRIEAAQKLQKQRPENLGQASRISGISPADISVLLIYLSTNYGKDEQ